MKNLTSKSEKKFQKVMHEFGQGELKSHDKKVTDQKQAIAIAFSEARKVYPNYGMKKKGGEIELTLEEVNQALKGKEFWINPTSKEAKIIEEATKKGYVLRTSHTQAEWTEKGIEALKEPAAVKGLFSLDAIEGKKFPGYTFGDDWNGWATPYFEKPEANLIMEALGGTYKDGTYLFDDGYGGEEEYEKQTIETVDGPKDVYAIGAYSWTWSNDLMKNGGGITGARAAELARIYEKGTAKQLWEAWTPDNRVHFLLDHAVEFFELMGDNYTRSSNGFAVLSYDALPSPIRKSLIIHHAQGMYAGGGGIGKYAGGGGVGVVPKSVYTKASYYLSFTDYDEMKKMVDDIIAQSKIDGSKMIDNVGNGEVTPTEEYEYEFTVDDFLDKIGYHPFSKRKRMAGGGGVNEGVDLFEDYENTPPKVQKILDKYQEGIEGEDYQELQKAKDELEKIGYTFEFYLDGTAYDLRKIGQKGKVDVWEENEKAKEEAKETEEVRAARKIAMEHIDTIEEKAAIEHKGIKFVKIGNKLIYVPTEDKLMEVLGLMAGGGGIEDARYKVGTHTKLGPIKDIRIGKTVKQFSKQIGFKPKKQYQYNIGDDWYNEGQVDNYVEQMNKGGDIPSKLSPAKKKLLERINTLKSTKSNAGAAAQKAIQKKIDVLQKQFDYNPSAKERALANKGKFALDVPTKHSKFIYKKLWGMKILPRIHTLNGTSSIVVNSQINLVKAYRIYSDLLKEKGESVPPLSKISRKL